jgi:hypothetical protein
MRVPDRHWAEARTDGSDNGGAGWRRHAGPADLAGRLARLVAGHPSADLDADPGQDDLDTDDLDPAEVDPRDLDPDHLGGPDPDSPGRDELNPDDLEAADIDAGVEAKRPATDGFRPLRSPDPPSWDGFGGAERSPYRPWFSADGASDPWFAEPTDRAGQ